MHLIKIGWCHSLFSEGKEQVTSEYPQGWRHQINDEIIIYKKESDIMFLFGHDDVIKGMIMPSLILSCNDHVLLDQ